MRKPALKKKQRHVIEVEPLDTGGHVVRHTVQEDPDAMYDMPTMGGKRPPKPKTTTSFHQGVPNVSIGSQESENPAEEMMEKPVAPKMKGRGTGTAAKTASFIERMKAARSANPKKKAAAPPKKKAAPPKKKK